MVQMNDNTDNTLDRLYGPPAAMDVLDVKPSSFYDLIATGVIPPADIYLSPKRPRWKASTLKKVQDRLAASGAVSEPDGNQP
jgi:hypothetical protein